MSKTHIELFAGCGGMALGFERAGFSTKLLVEIDKTACNTLKENFDCKIKNSCISKVNYSKYKNKIDIVTAGIPCQPYSFAGKGDGLNDERGGKIFDYYLRVIKCIKPKMLLIENVPGLLSHNNGKTLRILLKRLKRAGYPCINYKVLDANDYSVPQIRKRIFLICVKEKYKSIKFKFPKPKKYKPVLNDVLDISILYRNKLPNSDGVKYSKEKRSIMKLIPEGGNWKNLPKKLQKSYMGKSYYASGGKTTIARRLHREKPCLTLTCSPAQKRTERCHPYKTRPLKIREYARIQTFPDDFIFCGSISNQYKQIGNAVPVNLAYYLAKTIKKYLTKLE